MLKFFLVADNLECYDFASFVVNALYSLAKAALTKEVKNFESVGDVVFESHIIIPALVIIAKVVLIVLRTSDFASF